MSSDGSLIDDATVAWRVELTPLHVVKDAVTFRLRWIRVAAPRQLLNQLSLDGKVAGATTEDLELTLRPGESWPMDRSRCHRARRPATDGPAAPCRRFAHRWTAIRGRRRSAGSWLPTSG